MKRVASIEALLKTASAQAKELHKSYEASLHSKHISDELRVATKNIFENLRSCLDYIAHDILESKCVGARPPDRLYFPIRHTSAEFQQAIAKDFPNLEVAAPLVYSALESVQPYKDQWLGQFNKLNNHSKHQDLVEQSRTETREVKVSGGGGSVSWGQGVSFGSGVSVMGVPIDPKTQMPVPNNIVQTHVTTWVDFRFKEVGEPVLPFVNSSVQRVTQLFQTLRSIA